MADLIPFYEAEKKAWQIIADPESYAYFYGAKRVILTDHIMESLWQQYYEEYNYKFADDKKEIFNWSRGKIGLDCSGFVGHCVGELWSYSKALIDHCPYVTDNLAEGLECSVLWKPGHVGLDMGRGYVAEFGRYKHSIEINRIKERDFKLSGRIRTVDYYGATNL